MDLLSQLAAGQEDFHKFSPPPPTNKISGYAPACHIINADFSKTQWYCVVHDKTRCACHQRTENCGCHIRRWNLRATADLNDKSGLLVNDKKRWMVSAAMRHAIPRFYWSQSCTSTQIGAAGWQMKLSQKPHLYGIVSDKMDQAHFQEKHHEAAKCWRQQTRSTCLVSTCPLRMFHTNKPAKKL